MIRGTYFATLQFILSVCELCERKNTRDSRDTWKREEKILSVYDFFLTLQAKQQTKMQGKNFDVFISYRRSDGDKVARILDLAFKNAGYRTFLDYNSIEGGLFEQKIKVAIEDAPVFVMVMTPDYFKRCNEEGDWVRKEIELALVNEKTIIPISIDNIVDKVPTDLDEDFRAKVGAHNFAIVYTNSIFEVSFEKMLKERIQKVSDIIQNARNKAKVKVTADADCDLKRGDELIATLQAGRENLIYISGGQYKLKAVSCDYRDIQQDISINISNVSFEYDFDVNLADKVKARRNDIQGPNYAEIAKQKAEAERIAREKAEAERRERERRQREEKARRRREERERRKEEFKEWWERNKSKCVMLLAVIAGAVAGTWCIKNCKGTTETATETAVETKTETQTETPIIVNEEKQKPNEDSILQAEAQRQAELEIQKAQQEKKRQAEEKKKLDKKKFNEYKEKGDYHFDMFLADPDDNNHKYQARYYYGLALQYKEDATIRDCYNKLKK